MTGPIQLELCTLRLTRDSLELANDLESWVVTAQRPIGVCVVGNGQRQALRFTDLKPTNASVEKIIFLGFFEKSVEKIKVREIIEDSFCAFIFRSIGYMRHTSQCAVY